MLEMTAAHVRAGNRRTITSTDLAAASEANTLLYDKSGEEHYNVTSAFIKAMRGSDPDAALYYMMRMVEAGDDPLFILRRMLIFASEDIGNADPRALTVATSADEAFRRMGMPEGIFPMAHACLYLASAPKSDGVKKAIGAVSEAIRARGALPVPLKLRNAVTGLMKREGYGEGYRYAHDFEDHVARGKRICRALTGSRSTNLPRRDWKRRSRSGWRAFDRSRGSHSPARAPSISPAAWVSPFFRAAPRPAPSHSLASSRRPASMSIVPHMRYIGT
jgi:putative ATPase